MTAKHHTSKTYGRIMFETLETAHGNRVEASFLIDLRRNSRKDTCFPGEAFAEGGEHVYVLITNISISGLRLEGCWPAADLILSNLKRRNPDTDFHATLKVHFSVPIDSTHHALVKVHCRTVYSRQAGNDTYQIGMEFVRFKKGRAALAQYLSYRGASDEQ